MNRARGITRLVNVIANYIASRYDAQTVAVIASIFVQIGDTLVTIAAIENKQNNRF